MAKDAVATRKSSKTGTKTAKAPIKKASTKKSAATAVGRPKSNDKEKYVEFLKTLIVGKKMPYKDAVAKAAEKFGKSESYMRVIAYTAFPVRGGAKTSKKEPDKKETSKKADKTSKSSSKKTEKPASKPSKGTKMKNQDDDEEYEVDAGKSDESDESDNGDFEFD